MNSHSKLIELFSKDFICEDLLIRTKADNFRCPNINKCQIETKEEAQWSPVFGDPDSQVMIIAEAPSTAGGIGPHIGGKMLDWNEDIIKPLKNFVKEYYNTAPYFTDVVKCGVSKQTKDIKSILPKRIKNCVERFLLNEITIINPTDILCIGKMSYLTVKELKKNHKINGNIKLFPLLHYGRQANLPVTSYEKEKFIWPLQIGKNIGSKIKELKYFSDKNIDEINDNDWPLK